jgi:hypothetical protein
MRILFNLILLKAVGNLKIKFFLAKRDGPMRFFILFFLHESYQSRLKAFLEYKLVFYFLLSSNNLSYFFKLMLYAITKLLFRELKLNAESKLL